MAEHETPDELDGLTARPLLIEATLLPDADARASHERIAGIRTRALVAIALASAIGALLIGTLTRGHRRAAPAAPAAARDGGPAAPAAAREGGPAGVAAAYGFPLRCLSVTIAPANHAYARADFNRASLCGRYDGDVTAVFHRVERTWRPVLDTTSYSCPVASISPVVQTELGICP